MNTLVKIATNDNPVVTSFAPSTLDDKKRFYNALNNPTGDISDIINQQVELTDYHMMCEERTSEDGFAYERVKTTVILSDGRVYTTTYKSFAKSLVQLMQVFGLPEEWENHKLAVVVRSVKYQGGLHDGLTIDVV